MSLSPMTADSNSKSTLPQRVQVPQPTGPEVVPPLQVEPSPIRAYLNARTSGRLADNVFRVVMLVCACSIFAIVLFIFYILISRSKLSLAAFGFKFFTRQAWDPVQGDFGALPFIFGTVATSLLALLMAVPLALGVAVFLTELCPQRLRAPISFLTELLAAIPSVVYGLWAVFVLVPIMRDQLGPFLATTLGWTGLFEGSNFGVGLLTASIILAIMILPIISSLTRDIMNAVPNSQREAVLALGATRWEMIRIGVLRNSALSCSASDVLLARPWPSPWSSATTPTSANPSSPRPTPWPALSLESSLKRPVTSTSPLSLKLAWPSSS